MTRILPALLTRILFAIGIAGISQAQVSSLEWLEAQTLEDPIGHRSSLGQLGRFAGEEGALALRWEEYFDKASGKEERERWALLLAFLAQSKKDLETAHRWQGQAGDSMESLTLGASLKAMANDPAGAEALIRRALAKAERIREPEILLATLVGIRTHVLGHPLGPAEQDELEEELWQQTDLTPRVRLAIGRKLNGRKTNGPAAEDWTGRLEKACRTSKTAWVEAILLSDLRFAERHVDEAWAWLERAEESGAPESILSAARFRIVASADPSPTTQAGLDLRARLRVETLELPAEHLIRELEGLSSSVDEEAAKALHRHAEIVLSAPLHWKLFGGTFYSPETESAFYKALNKLFGDHLEANPDDLMARYGYGLLLAEEARSGSPGGSTEMLKNFVREASSRVGEALERREAHYSSRVFSVIFPDPEPEPAAPHPRKSGSIFTFPRPPGNHAWDYPSRETAVYRPATLGDLLLKALRVLREGDFDEAYANWVEIAQPPLSVRLPFLKGKGSAEQKVEAIDHALAAGEIDIREAERLLAFTGHTPEQGKALGKIILEERPEYGPAIELALVRTLIHAERYEDAEKALAKLRTLARPGHEVEQWNLWSVSNLLAKESGDPDGAPPSPRAVAAASKEPEEPWRPYLRYFDGSPSPLPFIPHQHPYLQPLALVTPEDRESVVMLSWVTEPIDVALALFETGFASTHIGDFRTLTPEDYEAIEEALGEETPALAAVRAFYDPVGLPPEQQLDRIAVVAIKHPGVPKLHAVVAALALRLGQHQRALDAVSRIEDAQGDLAWLAAGIELRCGRALGKQDVAQGAALALLPITYRRDECAWLITQLDQLGLADKARDLEAPRPYRK